MLLALEQGGDRLEKAWLDFAAIVDHDVHMEDAIASSDRHTNLVGVHQGHLVCVYERSVPQRSNPLGVRCPWIRLEGGSEVEGPPFRAERGKADFKAGGPQK